MKDALMRKAKENVLSAKEFIDFIHEIQNLNKYTVVFFVTPNGDTGNCSRKETTLEAEVFVNLFGDLDDGHRHIAEFKFHRLFRPEEVWTLRCDPQSNVYVGLSKYSANMYIQIDNAFYANCGNTFYANIRTYDGLETANLEEDLNTIFAKYTYEN